MSAVTFFRSEALPFFEAKHCTISDLAYKKHFHEEYSIGLIDEGETNAWCDGTMYLVEAGRMISFPPLMLHACHPDPQSVWKYKMLFIKQEWIEQLEVMELEQLHIPFLLTGEKNQICRHFMGRAMEAFAAGGTPLEIETKVVELIQALVNQNALDVSHPSASIREQKYVARVREYLHDRFTEKITLEELEKAAGISKFHLIRLFKKANHVPPHAYQNLLRINHAKAELAKRRPIAEIAVETGYYDQSHFVRAFTKIVGATPQQYALSL